VRRNNIPDRSRSLGRLARDYDYERGVMESDRQYEPPVVEDLETEAEGATLVVTKAGAAVGGSPLPIGLAAPLEGEDPPPKPSE
jgi:hypothetical protein